MTILEDLKSGRLVVVPREALADLCNAVMADISEAKRRLDADIPKDAPVHPVSAFLTGTALHVGKARASPDHTAGLIALVEGMEKERERAESAINALDQERDGFAQLCAVRTSERDAAQEQADSFKAMYRQACGWRDEKIADAEARALAAEAEVVRLKARIADLEERHYAD